MNIKVEIKAPELAQAIQSLADALSSRNGIYENVVALASDGNKEVAPAKEEVKPKPEKAPVKEEPATKEEPQVKEEPTVSLEVVRGKLAALSQAGKQAEVKALISSFGVKKLTEVPAESYAALLEKAEAL